MTDYVEAYNKRVRLELDSPCTSRPDCKCHFCTVTRYEPTQVLYPMIKKYKRYTHAELVQATRAEYQQQRVIRQPLLDASQWELYVLSIPQICRIEAFAEVAHHFEDRMYWGLFGHIFCPAVNFGLYRDLYLTLLRAPRPHHHYFHNAEQQAGWDSLPERVAIYRGHGPHNKHGIWYSLNPFVAIDYAHKHNVYSAKRKDMEKLGSGRVSSYVVSKRDLLYGGDHIVEGIHEEAVFFVQGLGDIQAGLLQQSSR